MDTEAPLLLAAGPTGSVVFAPILRDGSVVAVLWVAVDGEHAGCRCVGTGPDAQATAVWFDLTAKDAAMRAKRALDPDVFLVHWRESLRSHPHLTLGLSATAESVESAASKARRGELIDFLL